MLSGLILNRTFAILCASFLLSAQAYCTSIYLINDSAYTLRAIIRARDGSYVGEMIIPANGVTQWTDGGNVAGGLEQYPRSRSPFSVSWYCPEGEIFSVDSKVTTGGSTSALGAVGSRSCRPQKQEPHNKVPDGYLAPSIQPKSDPQPNAGG